MTKSMRRLAGRVSEIIRDQGQGALALHDLSRSRPESMKKILSRLRDDNDSVLGSLLKAADTARIAGQVPADVFHPHYGWIYVKGNLTEAGERFMKHWEKDPEAPTIPDLA